MADPAQKNADPGPSATRVRFFGTGHDHVAIQQQEICSPDEIVRLWNISAQWSAVLIENPDEAWRTMLSKEDVLPTPVPQEFWELHGASLTQRGYSLWNSISNRRPRQTLEQRHHMHSIQGVFEYGQVESLTADRNNAPWQRPTSKSAEHGWISATRITYGCFGHMFIFVVDAPRTVNQGIGTGIKQAERLSPNRERPVLRLPYVTRTRGGLLVPHLFLSDTHALFESFESFLTHGWQLAAISRHQNDPDVLLTLLSISLWKTNLGLLKKDIEHVSFVEMRNQTRLQKDQTSFVNDRLHDRREDLAFLRREVQYLSKWIDPDLRQIETQHFSDENGQEREVDAIAEILEDSQSLQSFLMDTFQLWMAILRFESTLLNIQIEEASMAQAKATRKILEANNKMALDGEKRADESALQTSRATALTFLAALYLPTTLASGIFGMNVKEIGESNLATLWEFGVTLAGLFGFTGICMLGYYLRERYLTLGQAKAREHARARTD